MDLRKRPTLRAVRLGQELRKLREEAGHGVRALGGNIDVQPGMLSKKELGNVPVSMTDIDAYIGACDPHNPRRRDDLYKMSKDAQQKGWWDGYAEDVKGTLTDRIWLESKAERIDTFETIVLPGLLQTPGYAEALMRLRSPDASTDEIARWMEVRTTRQHVLTRHDPVDYRAIIDESVLKRTVGSPRDMRSQFDYLRKAADQDNIEIRVLPFAAGMHVSLAGAFEVLRLEGPYPPAGLIPVPDGDVCVEGTTIDVLEWTYDQLLRYCLTPNASKKLISEEGRKL